MTTVSEQTKMRFIGVDFFNVKYDFIGDVENFSENPDINVDCNPRILYYEEDQSKFSIIMDVRIHSSDSFQIDLRAVGFFQLSGDNSTDIKESLININAPAIMFPYVRSFISTFTANIGQHLNTVVLPTQFFKGKLEEYKDN